MVSHKLSVPMQNGMLEIEMWNINIAIVKGPLNSKWISNKSQQKRIETVHSAMRMYFRNQMMTFRVRAKKLCYIFISFDKQKRKSRKNSEEVCSQIEANNLRDILCESAHKASFIIHNIVSISPSCLFAGIRRVAIFICAYIYRQLHKWNKKKNLAILDTHTQSNLVRMCSIWWSLLISFFSINNIFVVLHSHFVSFFLSGIFTGWDSQHNHSLGIKFCTIDWRWWQIDNMSCGKSKSNRTISGNNVEIECCL